MFVARCVRKYLCYVASNQNSICATAKRLRNIFTGRHTIAAPDRIENTLNAGPSMADRSLEGVISMPIELWRVCCMNGQLTLSRRTGSRRSSKTKNVNQDVSSTSLGLRDREPGLRERQKKINKIKRGETETQTETETETETESWSSHACLKYTPLGRRNAKTRTRARTNLQRGGESKKQFQIFSLPACRIFTFFWLRQSFRYLFYCCCVIVRTKRREKIKEMKGEWNGLRVGKEPGTAGWGGST